MWIQPKTDWKPADSFELSADYARIRGNILHLQEMARELYLPFELAQMKEYGPEDFAFAEFFANVDGNADALLDACWRPARQQRARDYRANGRIWNADDLNRIESGLLRLYRAMCAQKAARQRLAFRLGGGIFAAGI